MNAVLFSAFFLFSTIFNPVSSVSCKDESGSNIPTWTIMKLPQGTDYYYYDIESDLLKSDIEKYMETYGYETGTINICIYQINYCLHTCSRAFCFRRS